MQRRQATLIKNDDPELMGDYRWKLPAQYGHGTVAKGVGGVMIDDSHMLDLQTGKIITRVKGKRISSKRISRRK